MRNWWERNKELVFQVCVAWLCMAAIIAAVWLVKWSADARTEACTANGYDGSFRILDGGVHLPVCYKVEDGRYTFHVYPGREK